MDLRLEVRGTQVGARPWRALWAKVSPRSEAWMGVMWHDRVLYVRGPRLFPGGDVLFGGTNAFKPSAVDG